MDQLLGLGLGQPSLRGGIQCILYTRVVILRKATVMTALIFIIFAACFPTWGASSPTKITIHIPGKSLSVMSFYFGKDKGFFAEEGIDVQLVAMSPPVAIAAMVAGELDFSTTLGAATAAIMRAVDERAGAIIRTTRHCQF